STSTLGTTTWRPPDAGPCADSCEIHVTDPVVTLKADLLRGCYRTSDLCTSGCAFPVNVVSSPQAVSMTDNCVDLAFVTSLKVPGNFGSIGDAICAAAAADAGLPFPFEFSVSVNGPPSGGYSWMRTDGIFFTPRSPPDNVVAHDEHGLFHGAPYNVWQMGS